MTADERIEAAMPLLIMALAAGNWGLVEHAVEVLNADTVLPE